jgi:glycosyltransferase involved in cell wall biosynthesis
VLPAYNAAATLEAVVAAVPQGFADEWLLVDDASQDDTVAVARRLGIPVIVHPVNRGYGANQKTCYTEMLARGVDIIAMLHPDGQYPGGLLPDLTRPIAEGRQDLMLGSRFHGLDPRDGGMPAYKYVMNRILTGGQNALQGTRLSEFHTGYRAYSAALMRQLPLSRNRDDFTFDAEVLAQCIAFRARVGEVPSPARYFEDASSLGFLPSVRYGLGVVSTTLSATAHRHGLRRDLRFVPLP